MDVLDKKIIMGWVFFVTNIIEMEKESLLKNVFLVLLGVGLTFLVDYYNKSEKSLSFEIISKSEIFNMQNESYYGMQILVDSTIVKSVNSAVIKFSNDGDIPLMKTEFESDIKINFSESTNILKSSIIEKSPNDLNPIFYHSKNVISIEPLLLNSKDEFVVQVLSEGDIDSLFVSARIAGIGSITEREIKDENEFPLSSKIWFIVLTIAITLVYTSINTSMKLSPNLEGYRFINREELAWNQLIIFIVNMLLIISSLIVLGIESVWLQLLIMIVYLSIFNEFFRYFKVNGYKKIKDLNIEQINDEK